MQVDGWIDRQAYNRISGCTEISIIQGNISRQASTCECLPIRNPYVFRGNEACREEISEQVHGDRRWLDVSSIQNSSESLQEKGYKSKTQLINIMRLSQRQIGKYKGHTDISKIFAQKGKNRPYHSGPSTFKNSVFLNKGSSEQ